MKNKIEKITDIPRFCCQALDIIADGVYFIDKNEKLLFWNKGAENILGYSKDELEGLICPSNIRHRKKKGVDKLINGLCSVYWCIKNKKPKVYTVYLDTKFGKKIAIEIHGVPLFDEHNKIKGVLAVLRDVSAYKDLEKAYRKINRISQIDHLTAVLNKKAIEERVSLEIRRARRYNFPISLAIADIDFFKKINDTYGHRAGDFVIKQVSKVLKNNLRSVDIVGRLGGDEFALIFPHIKKEEAVIPVERLRNLVRQLKFNKITSNVTISFGIAQLLEEDTVNSFIQRADKNLYKAKELGRDRVVTEEKIRI